MTKLKDKLYNLVVESLDPKQKATVDAWGDGSAAKSISGHIFDGDKDIIPLVSPDDEPVRPPTDLEDFLHQHNFKVHDYVAGLAKEPKYGRLVKIGKALEGLGAPDELKKNFINDPRRDAARVHHNLEVAICRHPHDVAGMSTNRGWTSCMDLDGGAMNPYIKADIEHGTHAAYLIQKGDHDIEKPLARKLLKPFKSYSGHTVLIPETENYGTPAGSFDHTINKWVNENFTMQPNKIYRMPEEIYADGLGSGAINLKDSDPEEILKHDTTIGLVTGSSGNDEWREKFKDIDHPIINRNLMNYGHPEHKEIVFNRAAKPYLTGESDDADDVLHYAAYHDQFHKRLLDVNDVRPLEDATLASIYHQSNENRNRIVDTMKNHAGFGLKQAIISKGPAEHIEKIRPIMNENDHNYLLRAGVNATKEQTDEALKHVPLKSNMGNTGNPHVLEMLEKSPDVGLQMELAKYPKHELRLSSHPNAAVRNSVAYHTRSDTILRRLANDDEEHVREAATRRLKELGFEKF